MRKFQGNRVRNGEVIRVFRQAYSASFISIESSSIVGSNQIPLWVHLNFSPLHETSSQGPKPNHAHIARTVWL